MNHVQLLNDNNINAAVTHMLFFANFQTIKSLLHAILSAFPLLLVKTCIQN